MPVISGITVNNGINYYTEDIPADSEIFNDSLTISTRGEYSGTVTYHEGEFVLANNILVMKMPNLTKNQKIFIGSIINNLSYGGYSNYPRIETLKEDFIFLPTKNGKIDFDFMDEYINFIEDECIDKISFYLEISQLDNYILTEEELSALNRYDEVKYADFEITEVFNIKNTKNILSRDVENRSGKDPYLCASTVNNSVSSYVEYDEKLKDKGNCIFIGGKTFVVTYQKDDFYSNDSHNLALYLKEYNINRYNQLFFATCVDKSLSYKYSWGDSVSKTKIQKDIISLPIKNGKPDIDFMNVFMTAIHKLVIKDIVLYTKKKTA